MSGRVCRVVCRVCLSGWLGFWSRRDAYERSRYRVARAAWGHEQGHTRASPRALQSPYALASVATASVAHLPGPAAAPAATRLLARCITKQTLSTSGTPHLNPREIHSSSPFLVCSSSPLPPPPSPSSHTPGARRRDGAGGGGVLCGGHPAAHGAALCGKEVKGTRSRRRGREGAQAAVDVVRATGVAGDGVILETRGRRVRRQGFTEAPVPCLHATMKEQMGATAAAAAR